jgi:uncharacterized protein (DUF58 family)
MNKKDLLQKVQSIQITTARLVNDILGGEYHSTFKGQGIEFDAVRDYEPGDDIRRIDWKVTARMGKPFIKTFVEERELTVMLMVDASHSGLFGSVDKLKSEYAVELCAVLAFSAIKNNDKVGLIIFTDTVEKYMPPKKGKTHVLSLINDLLSFQPKHKGTDIDAALHFLNSVHKRKCVSFFISDFLDTNFERSLQIANKRHDVVAITISDKRETDIPEIGLIEFEDAETGQRIRIDSSNRHVQNTFKHVAQKAYLDRESLFKRVDVDVIHTETGVSYVKPLIQFFKKREKRH